MKTYELELEHDEVLEKGRKKGSSVALVAEDERKCRQETARSTL